MEIQAYGDDGLTYLVSSESRKGHHKVSLEAYSGLGECSCEHHRLTLVPRWKTAGKPNTDEYRCKHIKAARRYLTDLLIKKLSNRTKTNTRST